MAPRTGYVRSLLVRAQELGDLSADTDVDLAVQMLTGSVLARRFNGMPTPAGMGTPCRRHHLRIEPLVELGQQLAAAVGVVRQTGPEGVHPGQFGLELLGQRLVEGECLLEEGPSAGVRAALVRTSLLAR